MRALLTGGAGFIGSHLADALVASGHDVTVIDDLSTGSMENIAGLRSHPRFRFVAGSILDDAPLAGLVDEADVVFHLAAAVGVRLVIDAPVRTIETNVHGTRAVLAHAKRAGAAVVIFSTSEVYGKSAAVPFREDADLVLGPTDTARWAYAGSKVLDEFLALAYAREHRLHAIVVRLFNTVGPRQTGRYGMVVPSLVRQALRHEPMTVYGDGHQSRSFADVGDVVRGIIRLAEEPRAVGQVFNIGSNEETTILDLAARVRALTKSPSEIVLVPYRTAYGEGFEDMPRRVPDLTRIGRLIDYRPTQGLDDMLGRVISAMRSRGVSDATRST
jgi:UDP-glucose 4-epimerase